MERPRTPLTFGTGLDRATGLLDLQPEQTRDVRNVFLYRGKAQARTGYVPVNNLLDDADVAVNDVVLVHPMLSEQLGIIAGFSESDDEIHLYRVDGDGGGTNRMGVWFTLDASARRPPRALAAEQYRKVFFAHDEPQYPLRGPTRYYDPYAGTVLNDLTADLDRDSSAETLRFRGVAPYLNYLVGWGYGTDADPDRPDVVRMSRAGQPTVFEPEHYLLAGLGDEPVLNCVPTVDRLIVFKASQTFEITGYDRRTFGIHPGEKLFGLAASRLAVSVNGVIYYWSIEGPRRTTGGASRDLSWPLDLDAPAPSDLVAEGSIFDGFVEYLPQRRLILFVFGRRVYALSLWNPEQLKWSYWEFAHPMYSGGLIYGGGELQTGVPTGAATSVTAGPGDTDTLNVAWTNTSFAGDEFVEIHMKPTGGSWSLQKSVQVTTSSQNTDVDSLPFGTDHETALRYRRGPYYTVGYESTNPDDWPAASKATGTTTVDAPTLDSTSWTRVSAGVERTTLNWTRAHPTAPTKVFRDSVEIAEVAAGLVQYLDDGVTGEVFHDYVLKHVGPDANSADSNELTQWSGPDLPPTFVSLVSVTAAVWDLDWTNGDASLATDLWLENVTDAEAAAFRKTRAAGGTSDTDTETGDEGDLIRMNARHKETAFAVDDFSPWFGGGATFAATDESVTLAS